MSQFLRLLSEEDKADALATACANWRNGEAETRIFNVSPKSFYSVPGSPFAYWVSEDIRGIFKRLQRFESQGRAAQHGASTKDDFRFLRTCWEHNHSRGRWLPFAKGGKRSSFYSDIYMVVLWEDDAKELEAALLKKYPYLGESANWILHRECNYLRPGLTWPLRGVRFSSQLVPEGCIFSVAGKMAFVPETELMSWLALFNSSSFDYLIRIFAGKVGGVQYEIGLIGGIPVPVLDEFSRERLAELGKLGWSYRRRLASVDERSQAFLLPSALRARTGDYEPQSIEVELSRIQAGIDAIAYELYALSESDRQVIIGDNAVVDGAVDADMYEDEDVEDFESEASVSDALLSWCVGVAFGRFDWRLATGERSAPPEPDPFAPLPLKSPGMLPDNATEFYQHSGILVDDPGHPNDLARLVEQVLETVDASVTEVVQRWLQKDFFAFHLKNYSKSRRKAPIYWPLATASGSYTLWLYYPSLSDQTLFTAVNDFVDPKLDDVRKELQALRDKGTGRSKQDEKRLEALASLEHELADLRDSLLEIAPNYRPNHDDGVQITAAPLWKLFRLKPWQKVLKDTWDKLEKGDYDWAHLAMNYWPDRVRDKCVTDKSLAIAHELEHLYVAPEPVEKKTRGRKKAGSTE